MNWTDITEFRDAVSGYLFLLEQYEFLFNEQITERVSRLHRAISNIDLNAIHGVLERFNVNQTDIINSVESVERIATDLKNEIGDNMHKVIAVDPDVGKVFKFCDDLCVILSFELTFELYDRKWTDPTKADEDAVKKLELFQNGFYGNTTFDGFYSQYLYCDMWIHIDEYDPDDVDQNVDWLLKKKRRLNYLITQSKNAQITECLREKLELIQKEIEDWRNWEKNENELFTSTPPEPQPSQPSPAVQDATSPIPTIMDLMLIDDEQKQKLFETLQKLIVGNKGKSVALVFLVCVKYGLFRSKPTHKLLTSSFGDIGTKSGYNNYCNKGLQIYSNEEIQGIERHILPFVNGH